MIGPIKQSPIEKSNLKCVSLHQINFEEFSFGFLCFLVQPSKLGQIFFAKQHKYANFRCHWRISPQPPGMVTRDLYGHKSAISQIQPTFISRSHLKILLDYGDVTAILHKLRCHERISATAVLPYI